MTFTNSSGLVSEVTVADNGSYTQEGLDPEILYTVDVSVTFGGMMGRSNSILANTIGMYNTRYLLCWVPNHCNT